MRLLKKHFIGHRRTNNQSVSVALVFTFHLQTLTVLMFQHRDRIATGLQFNRLKDQVLP